MQITFRHMPPSAAVETRIREEAEALNHYYNRITHCRVVVDAPHKHHGLGGRSYHLTIEIGVPGSTIMVDHEPSLHGSLVEADTPASHKRDDMHADHADLYEAIGDSFGKARRQLEDYARILRGDTKRHAP